MEAAGISTVSLSSARSITTAANPPRAVFLDYPLGQTAGRAHAPSEQDQVLQAAFTALQSMTKPGSVHDIGLQWSTDHDWKKHVMRVANNDPAKAQDDRTPRLPTPQYQHADDRDAVDANCPSCIFFADS